jgi:hypothetical protein
MHRKLPYLGLSKIRESLKIQKTPSPLWDDCMDAGGRTTSGTVAEKVGVRDLKSSIYIPHPSPLPEGKGIFRGFHKLTGF